MKSNSFFSRLRRASGSSTGIGIALTASVILIAVFVNVTLAGIANRFSWYLQEDERYEHTVSGATDGYLTDSTLSGDVKIIFCDSEDNLLSDDVTSLVYNTARQMEERYGYLTVSCVNIFRHPETVEKYKYRVNEETGEREQVNTVSVSSVIIDGAAEDLVLPMSAFFILNDAGTITAYNGEEIFAAMIRRSAVRERPTAYLTVSHGETFAAAFYNRLVAAGYTVETVDLVTEDIPTGERGDLLLISNPRYDFVRGNAEKGIRSELDKVEAFAREGGMVYVMLDPLVTNTVQLEKTLSDWGLTLERSVAEGGIREAVMIRDSVSSTTTDGYSLITDFDGCARAQAMKSRLDTNGAGRVIVTQASPIAVGEKEGKTVSPILLTSSSSRAYANGAEYSSEGGYAVAAVSENEAGGGFFLVGSVYLMSQTYMTTNEYGNRDLALAMLADLSGAAVPTGCSYLIFNQTVLEDLTMREARIYTALIAVLLPVLVAVGGFVAVKKRRYR